VTDFAPTRRSYASTNPVWARDFLNSGSHDVQLDNDAFRAVFTDGVLPSGVVVALNAAGRGVPASTASSRPVGLLVNEETARAGGRAYVAVLNSGLVTERLLPANSGINATVKAALTAVVFI